MFRVGGFGYAEPPDEDWNQCRVASIAHEPEPLISGGTPEFQSMN